MGNLYGDLIELGFWVTLTTDCDNASELSVTVGISNAISLYGLPGSVFTSRSAGQVMVGGVLSANNNKVQCS